MLKTQGTSSKNFVKAYGEIIELEEHRIKWLARLVYSSQFELIVAFVILVNAVCLALLTMPDIDSSVRETLNQLDTYALFIYLGIRL